MQIIPGAGVFNNLAATVPPTVTDDASKGYTVGSRWLNLTTEVMWHCVDNTTGAAVWMPGSGHPGYLASKFYSTFRGIHNTGTAMAAADTLYVYPFLVRAKLVVATLNIRVVTGGASSHLKMGLWANKYSSGSGQGRPFGAPLAAVNTGQDSSSTPTNVSAAASCTLHPGIYWAGAKCDGTGPQCVSISSTSYEIEELAGRGTFNGSTALTGLSVAATFSSNMPTFAGSESWTDVVGNGIPIIRLGT
jgi:hypothetical protein